MGDSARMEVDQARSASLQGASGQPRHHWHNSKRYVPQKRMAAQTAYNIACLALLGKSPALLAAIVNLMDGRATPAAIRQWRRGKRRAPQWALALLATALQKRISELQHALDLISEQIKKAPD